MIRLVSCDQSQYSQPNSQHYKYCVISIIDRILLWRKFNFSL